MLVDCRPAASGGIDLRGEDVAVSLRQDLYFLQHRALMPLYLRVCGQ